MSKFNVRRILFRCLLATGAGLACNGCSTASKNEVVVMGMIHSGHRTSTAYSLDRVRQIIRKVNPDVVLCEIPPDRFDRATSEFETTGRIEEPRVSRFPEYTDALFPLTRELDFVIVPCAAWTRPMADDRRAKMEEFKSTRPGDWKEMTEAEAWMDRELEKEKLADDPRGIHTDRYDDIVRKGLEPYNRLFNDAIGEGGWDNINAGHYALISRALDERRGQGLRVLITFGAGHKNWFLDHLRNRSDIELVSLQEYLGE